MKHVLQQNWRIALGVSALVVTAAQFSRADVRLFFSDRSRGGEDEYVQLVKLDTEPVRFKMSRCSASGSCSAFGDKGGYSVADLQDRAYALMNKREEGTLTTAEAREADILFDLVAGIETPKIQWKNRRVATYNVKGSVDQFVKTIEKKSF